MLTLELNEGFPASLSVSYAEDGRRAGRLLDDRIVLPPKEYRMMLRAGRSGRKQTERGAYPVAIMRDQVMILVRESGG